MSQASTLLLPSVHRDADVQRQGRAQWPCSKQVPPSPAPSACIYTCSAWPVNRRSKQKLGRGHHRKRSPACLGTSCARQYQAQVDSETQAALAGKGDSNKASPLNGQLSGNLSVGLANGEDCRQQQQHVTQQPIRLNGTALEQRPSAKQQHPQQQLQVICVAVAGPSAKSQQQKWPSQDARAFNASCWL